MVKRLLFVLVVLCAVYINDTVYGGAVTDYDVDTGDDVNSEIPKLEELGHRRRVRRYRVVRYVCN